MDCTSVFSIWTRFFACTGDTATGVTDFRTFEFHSAFSNFNTISTHTISRGTNRNTIFINRKVVFVNGRSSTFSIKVDKWCYILAFEVLIIRHGIMCRIQKYFWNSVIRKKRSHPEKSVQESMRIMFWSTAKMRKYW